MLKAKYFQKVFVAVMAFVMSLVMSFAMTAINIGFVEYFFQLWLKAFSLSYLIAFPTALTVSPLAKYIATALTQTSSITSK